MKYRGNCDTSNLNQQIFCRRCDYQFEDFDWNTVERENIFSDSLNNQFRETERNIHKFIWNKPWIK